MHRSVCLLQVAVMLAVSPECSGWSQFVNPGDKTFIREDYYWFKQIYDCYRSWSCTKCEETDNRWYDNITLRGAEPQYHQRAVCCNCAPGLSAASDALVCTLLVLFFCSCIFINAFILSNRSKRRKPIIDPS